jgi:hypothetical protein
MWTIGAVAWSNATAPRLVPSPQPEVEMQPWFGSDLLVDRLAGLGVRYLA